MNVAVDHGFPLKIRPVILSGGSGTRLWPVSRRCFPKQFAPLLGDESLFARALHMVEDRSFFSAPMVIGSEEHKFLILDALESLGIRDARVILEPQGRNTAAAAIVAALAEKNGDELHLVMPSDHVIQDRNAFFVAVRKGSAAAGAAHIALFGMTPSYPETGYGYISQGENSPWTDVFHIHSFQEKPDLAGARKLIENAALWNSGMFLYRPDILIKEVEQLAPEHLSLCAKALENSHLDLNCTILAADAYAAIKPEPFDRLIMEHTKRGCVVPCSIGWNDAGSWQALWQMGTRDTNGNQFLGPVLGRDVSNAYVRSDGPIVALMGISDMAVIVTRDAVLISPRERAQDVKDLVAEIGLKWPEIAAHHSRVMRPWGTYESLAQGENFQVKHIVVQPGRSLSLQKHHHRAEHWVVVVGTAKIERDGVEQMVFPNESVFVPRGAVHRLSNPGKIPLHLIEVQSGDYLGEDDIVRLDDPYKRTTPLSTVNHAPKRDPKVLP